MGINCLSASCTMKWLQRFYLLHCLKLVSWFLFCFFFSFIVEKNNQSISRQLMSTDWQLANIRFDLTSSKAFAWHFSCHFKPNWPTRQWLWLWFSTPTLESHSHSTIPIQFVIMQFFFALRCYSILSLPLNSINFSLHLLPLLCMRIFAFIYLPHSKFGFNCHSR